MSHTPTSGESGPTTPDAAPSSPPAALPLPTVLVTVGAAAALAKHYKGLADNGRARLNDAGSYLSEGASVPIRDPRNRRRKLGTYYVTDPEPVATVFDEALLLAFGQENMPEPVETVVDIDRERLDEVLDALRAAGLDDLIAEPVVTLRETVRKALLSRAVAGEAIPGVEVTEKGGVPTVRPADDSAATYLELVKSGAVDPDLLAA